MDKTTKYAIAIASVFALGGIILLIVSKQKKGGGKRIKSGFFGKKLELRTGTCFWGKIEIFKDDRKKSNEEFIKEGASLVVTNTNFDGTYKVEQIYRDDDGLIDFFTTSPKVKGESCLMNYDYKGKGKIIFKK
jgi:hypothetical protein